MPTYICRTPQGQLTADDRAEIAAGICRVHSTVTGAPIGFAQCLFDDIPHGGYFIGGRPGPAQGIWVYGLIRAGRTQEVKERLITGVRDLVAQTLRIDASLVWVYLNELNHSDMIEFGHILPAQGDEERWINRLP